MSKLLDITSGWTGILGPFTLLVDGVAQSLTGLTVVLIVHDSKGHLITLGGSITKLNQTSFPGQLTYSPVATDFVWANGGSETQVFPMHWEVTDGSGRVVSFPNAEADVIHVHKL